MSINKEVKETISTLLHRAWKEQGMNRDTTYEFIESVKEGLKDQAIGVTILTWNDDNDYEDTDR